MISHLPAQAADKVVRIAHQKPSALALLRPTVANHEFYLASGTFRGRETRRLLRRFSRRWAKKASGSTRTSLRCARRSLRYRGGRRGSIGSDGRRACRQAKAPVLVVRTSGCFGGAGTHESGASALVTPASAALVVNMTESLRCPQDVACLHGDRAGADRRDAGNAQPVNVVANLFRERGLPRAILRQRRAVRQPQRPVQSVQAVGVVAQARHCDRADQARPSATERPS